MCVYGIHPQLEYSDLDESSTYIEVDIRNDRGLINIQKNSITMLYMGILNTLHFRGLNVKALRADQNGTRDQYKQ